MDSPGTIADRVARRYCEGPHQGSTPCPTCALYRAIAREALHELGESLVVRTN